MSEEVYTVKLDEHRTVMHVQADSKGEARRFAFSGATVTRLSSKQVIDLTNNGVAIVSAATGKVCNARDEGASAGGNRLANPPSLDAE